MKKVLKSTLKQQEKRRIKREAKQLWHELKQQVNESQDNKCYMCNKELINSKSRHLHHCISRDIKELKYDRENLFLLCPACHKLNPLSVHQTSIWFAYLLEKKEPDRYFYLLNKILKEKDETIISN